MKRQVASVFAILLIFIASVENLKTMESCIEKFKDFEEEVKLSSDCMKTLNISLASIEKLTMEEYYADGYDDKCLMSCVMNGLKMVNSDGILDKEKFIKHTASHGPEGLAAKVTPTVNKCIEKQNEDFSKMKKDITPKQKCDLIHKTSGCINVAFEDAC